MNITCKGTMLPKWTLTDDRIIYKNTEIMLTDIIKVEHTECPTKIGNGSIDIYVPNKDLPFTLFYPYKQKSDGENAAEYILTFVGGEETKKEIERRKEIKKNGFRKRCNVCGKVFCFTLEDLERNDKLRKEAAMHSGISLMNGLFGTSYNFYEQQKQSDRALDKIVDFSKCPHCNSTDLRDITEQEWQNESTQNTNNSFVSVADELKKFKELLDIGVITQEEFDQKKKKLLGL